MSAAPLSLPLVDPATTTDPAARALLEQARAELGMVPNLYAALANLPALLETYRFGYDRFRAGAGFTAVEQEVVFLTISHVHGCGYCVAGHSLAGDYVSGVPAAVTDAIRVGAPVPDARLAALSDFARCMVTTRGQPDAAAVAAFRAAGFDDRHALGVVLAIATKTISNYANHLLGTPLDPMMAARAWP
jgi:uncharacterized peroxidase-related enzyme